MAPRRGFCKHYRARSEHDTCHAGAAYSKFNGKPYAEQPCFYTRGQEKPTGCDLAAYPTPEEEAERDKEVAAIFARTDKARAAIVAHCGGPWKKGMAGASGSLPCPVCNTGTLSYSRAGYNGHIHARCSTETCVSWME